MNDICIIHFQNYAKISVPCRIVVDMAAENYKTMSKWEQDIYRNDKLLSRILETVYQNIEVNSSTNLKTFHIYDIHVIGSFEIYLPGNLSKLFAKINCR